ncbi:MAG: hypothetical protein R3E97_07605 [Candidatus Eisenbacteria bacterium]
MRRPLRIAVRRPAHHVRLAFLCAVRGGGTLALLALLPLFPMLAPSFAPARNVLAPFVHDAVAEDEPALVAIEASRQGDEVVCGLVTSGLPGLVAEDTITRGLPIDLIVEIDLSVSETNTHIRSRHLVRVEPDLWDGDLRLLTSRVELRFPDIDALRIGLTHLGPFPCARRDEIRAGNSFQLDVVLSVDPVADDDGSPWGLFGDDETSNDRERSIGLGRLFRYLLGHGTQEAPSSVRGRSRTFTWNALPIEEAAQ